MVFNLLDLKTALKIPSNMYFDGTVLTQNQLLGGGKVTGFIEFPVVNLSGKLVFKILQIPKGGYFLVGVVSKKVYDSMN